MYSRILVDLALKELNCSQKELALRLGVSTTQISKWKKDEYISAEMETRLKELSNIGERDPFAVQFFEDYVQADKWESLLDCLGQLAHEHTPNNVSGDDLRNPHFSLSWPTFRALKHAGFDIPSVFPTELDFDYSRVLDATDSSSATSKLRAFLMKENAISSLVFDMYCAYIHVYGFYDKYMQDLFDESSLNLWSTDAGSIFNYLFEVSLCKVDTANLQIVPDYKRFKTEIYNNYSEWIFVLKDTAYRKKVPLPVELLAIVKCNPSELSSITMSGLDYAQRLHPDIYIDEILRGLRDIRTFMERNSKS